MMWRYWDWNGEFWNYGLRTVMVIVMGVWWVLIVVAAALLVRWLLRQERLARRDVGGMPGGGPPATAEDPLTILQKRYARGEITREQYEEIKETLLR